MGTAATSQDDIWLKRGLMLLFAFGVANLIGAIISFVAFNWTYLATGTKLGGLGLVLLVCAGLWVAKGFDRSGAASFGIAAQVMIGVWLAAAGQLYQAPGGLQDLAMNWALLGLPFAIASRSQAHWAVWFTVVLLFGLSPMGLTLREQFTSDLKWLPMLVAALIIISGLLACHFKSEEGWLTTVLAIFASVLLVGVTMSFWYEFGWVDVLVLVLTAGMALFCYRAGQRPGTIAFVTALMTAIFGNIADELLSAGAILGTFFLTLYVIGGTYALTRLAIAMAPDKLETAEEGEPSLPWYVKVLTGFGGIIAAAFLILLIASIIALSGLLEANWEIVSLIIGLPLWIGAMAVQRRTGGAFLTTFTSVFTLGGIGLIVGSASSLLGITNDEDLALPGLIMVVLAMISAFWVRGNSLFHGLMAVVFATGQACIVVDLMSGFDEAVRLPVLIVVYGLIGVGFAAFKISGDRHLGLAAFFLTLATVLPIIFPFYDQAVEIELVANLLIFGVGLAALYWKVGNLPGWPVIVAAMATVLLLPSGAGAAVLLTLFGYTLRHTPMFGLGALALAALMLDRYFGLELTLLSVAAFMAGVGIVLMAVWWLSQHRVEVAS